MNTLVKILRDEGLSEFLRVCRDDPLYKQLCVDNYAQFSRIILQESGINTDEDIDYAHIFKRLYSIDKHLGNNEKNI